MHKQFANGIYRVCLHYHRGHADKFIQTYVEMDEQATMVVSPESSLGYHHHCLSSSSLTKKALGAWIPGPFAGADLVISPHASNELDGIRCCQK
jgi:hypothetical protein